jgi:hypothetical protein
LHLPPAQLAEHVRARHRATGLDLGQEMAKALLNPRAQSRAERSVERAGVVGDPAHGVDDLVGQLGKRRTQHGCDVRWKLVPGLIGHFLYENYNFCRPVR